MKQTTLEYYKFILERVSFDAHLFEKEFKKAISNLAQEEASELKLWVKSNYAKYYSLIS
jgi:thymidylate synthase